MVSEQPVEPKPLARVFERPDRHIQTDNLVELSFLEQPLDQSPFAAAQVENPPRTRLEQRRDDGLKPLFVQAERLFERGLGQVLPVIFIRGRIVFLIGPVGSGPVGTGLAEISDSAA